MSSNFKIVTSKTPLRITFSGGGTDLPEYFKNYRKGAVLSSTINKYIYVTVAENFYKDEIRVSYSTTEHALKSIEQIQHPTVREALSMLDIKSGIQIVSITEIPSGGTGLGSSSAFLVGLLNALHTWIGEAVSPKQLAEEAVKIERDILHEPGGWQDQYIAAYGGINLFEFYSDGNVNVKKQLLHGEELRELQNRLLMFYTGKERKSSTIPNEQILDISKNIETYNKMGDLAVDSFNAISQRNWSKLGDLLKENWYLKKQLNNKISNSQIDLWYNKGIKAGAMGGKIMGAGGGGFLLFICNSDERSNIVSELKELQVEDVKLEPFGSRIVYLE